MSASGVLVVDKPAGPTSHDVVDRVRRCLGVRRVGHTGTLDPFATGVLPVCVGRATRVARFLALSDKTYRATVRLGFATTTDDREGEPLGEAVPVAVDAEAVREACRELTGPQDQVPPAFSAKRVGGKRSYQRARAGEQVRPPSVHVVVHRIDVTEVAGERVELEVACSAGTYVRALARDLGARLGVGGHLGELRRTRAAGFGLESAIPADALTEESARSALLPVSEALAAFPAIEVTEHGVLAVRHGRDLDAGLVRAFPEASPGPRVRIVDASGTVLALAVAVGFEPPSPALPAGRNLPTLPLRPCFHPDVVLVE